MKALDVDGLLKFPTIVLSTETASLSVEIFGGPLARVQATVFSAMDERLSGVGYGNYGPPLTTENKGQVSWLFKVDAKADYIKWGIQAIRNAANISRYSVTAKIRDASGQILAISQFAATIPDGQQGDDVIYDGIAFGAHQLAVLPEGKTS